VRSVIVFSSLLALNSLIVRAAPSPNSGQRPDPAESFEFKQDKKSLYEGLLSENANTRVRSAIFLWTNFPDGKEAAERVMEQDKDPNVRRRIAQVLASKHKNQRAIKVLRETMIALDIRTQSGAMSYLISAESLYSATHEVIGIDQALQILGASQDWFSEVNGSTWAYAQKDAARVMAASYLSMFASGGDKSKFQEKLRAYAADVERNINSSEGTERRYWEGRLPTTLDIALRSGMQSFVLSFDGKQESFKNKYEKRRMLRVIGRAKKSVNGPQ
jgi:hypothetical protein